MFNKNKDEWSFIDNNVFESIEICPYQSTVIDLGKPKGKSEISIEPYKKELAIINKDFKLKHELEYITLDKLKAMPQDDIKFNPYRDEDKENLDCSIKEYGLFSPIIVWKLDFGQNYILSGVERYKSYVRIYMECCRNDDEEGAKKYEAIPCYTIGKDDIDDLRARDILIDANLCSRRMDPISISNAIANKVAIKIAKKKRIEDIGRRSGINIMDEISEEMMRSKPTLYAYKKLQNLTRSSAYLLQSNRITLKSARKLADFSHEVQLAFLTEVGLDNVTDLKIEAFNPKENANEKELARSIERAKAMNVPYMTKVTISVPNKYVNLLLEEVEKIKKRHVDWTMRIKGKKLEKNALT